MRASWIHKCIYYYPQVRVGILNYRCIIEICSSMKVLHHISCIDPDCHESVIQVDSGARGAEESRVQRCKNNEKKTKLSFLVKRLVASECS